MKEGYKQTELGVIPEDWNTFKVKDLILNNIIDKPLDGNHGNIHPKAEDFVSEGIPFIMANDIINGKVDLINCSFISYEQASKLQKGFSIKGDILLTHKGSVGNVAKVPNLSSPYIMLTPQVTYYRIKNNKELNSDFLIQYFQCQAFQNLLRILSGGGTRAYIGITNQQNLPIILPPIEEQNAIADCLSTWDEAIEKQQKLIEAKEIRHKALMQKLLSGKKRLPGFTDEWKEVKLGDLFSERNETKYDDLPLLSIGQEGVYPQTDSNKRDISNGDKSKYKRIVPGDIGYNTMRMWQGRSALSNLEGIVSPAYTILTPKENVDSYFFSLLFKTTRLTNLFWRNSQGLVDDTLNCKYKDFSIIKCNIPSYEEQITIKEILKISEAEIEIEKKKIDQLKEQKKSLMQKLLTGKVRLPLNN